MTTVTDVIEKGDMHMQEVMRIGNEFVPADKDIKDVANTGTEIADVAKKYKTDMLAVIGKGDKHTLVTQYHETDVKLEADIIKTASLVQTMANTYNVNAADITDAIKIIVNKGE